MGNMVIEKNLVVDEDTAKQIIQTCGAESFAVYCASEVFGNSFTTAEASEFCGLSRESTEIAWMRLTQTEINICGRNLIVDSDTSKDIIQNCGPATFAVYCALEVLGNPCTITDVAKFCGFSVEYAQKACVRLGLHELGIYG